MLDVAIIGGGVCGLALAHSLHARQRDWRLFEARQRLGGRVLTVRSSQGLPLDLGPSWYWPAQHRALTRLVADLGLASLAQPDDGQVLHLHDPNRAPERVTVAVTPDGRLQPAPAGEPAQPGRLHGGARRLAGGMQALVQALAAPLPAARLQTGLVLKAVIDHGDFVELRLHQPRQAEPARELSVQARRVVLALPPRLVAELNFQPALSPALLAELTATPTWMASAAKAAWAFERPFWREAGHSGNAWVTHPQAVLAEVFDASPPGAGDAPDAPDAPAAAGPQGGALAGFLALGAQARREFATGMDLLLHSQVAQLFGLEAQAGELHRQDWAEEPFTCSALDREEDGRGGHPAGGEATALQQPHWQGRLHFGGSETARQHAGYLEGALSAAARLRQALAPATTPGTAAAPAPAPQAASAPLAPAGAAP